MDNRREVREVFGKRAAKKKDYYDKDDAGMPDMSMFDLSRREALYAIKNVLFADELAKTLTGATHSYNRDPARQRDAPPQPNSAVKTRPVDAALASDIMNDAKVADDDIDDEEEDSQSQCPDSDGEEEPDLADTDDDDDEEDSQSQCHNTDAEEESDEESVCHADFNRRKSLKLVDEYVQSVNLSHDKNLAVNIMPVSYTHLTLPTIE